MKYFYFNVDLVEEVLEYNHGFNISNLDTLQMLRDDAELSIQNRHKERLEKCTTLRCRTKSSKLRLKELEELAVEFQQLLTDYYKII